MDCDKSLTNCYACLEDPLKCYKCDKNSVQFGDSCVQKDICKQDENCAECYGDGPETCQMCRNGVRPVPGAACPEHTCEDKNCEVCEDQKICTKCTTSFQAIGGKCESADQCKKYDQNCETCSIINAQLCVTCTNKADLIEGMKCPKQPTQCDVKNCEKCEIGNNFICDSCKSGYYAAENGNCVTYNPTNNCEIQSCGTCYKNQPTECQVCVPGYTLYGNNCYPNWKGLENLKCVDTGCKKCKSSNIFKCEQCKSDFTLIGFNCVQNNQCKSDINCLECTINDYERCQTCKNGQPPLNENCPKHQCNVKNCINCSPEDADICLECENFAQANDPAEITVCAPSLCLIDENCATCSQVDHQECVKCKSDDMVLLFKHCVDKNACTQIYDNCGSCDTEDPRVCGECISDEFVMIQQQCFSRNECLNIDIGCAECDLSKPTVCSKCQDGTVPVLPQSCDKPLCVVENCIECTAGDNSQCQKCENLYAVTSIGQCGPGNCQSLSQDEKKRDECIQGFFQNSDALCEACMQNCLSCSSADDCQICDDSFQLVDGRCENVKNNQGVIIGVSVGVSVVVIITIVVAVVIIIKKKKATTSTNQRIAALN